ncbi:No apical meristem (NAM) protein [Artemisia annua]|uniref:No apical meristem (NAM) protein n=1 Tax=Artemisia annua TaxID=35608 RepID=A0A2U1KD70_ARTAN|nr:No apical meristem (NAM) protein [Artemisia annua]
MCPPAFVSPAAELNEYSTYEDIFKLIMQLKSGHGLPLNVLSDVDPYQFTPSNLPAEVWYLWSGKKTDAVNGFWKSTGVACEIYSTSTISGLRKTFNFYEGRSPDGKKTNWIMQKYTATDKFTSKPDQKALYRVFMVDDNVSGQISKSELMAKNIDVVGGPSSMVNRSPDPPVEDFLELNDLVNPLSPTTNGSPDRPSGIANRSPDLPIEDDALSGDFLELNDLDIPLSRSTSSADSSCMTMSMTSEELFDDLDALLGELGDDTVDTQIQDSNVKLNVSAPAKLKEVVVQPTTLESLNNGEETKLCKEETSKTNSTPQNDPADHCIASTSNGVNATPSPSSSEGSSKEEKRDRANRHKKRKMMKYLCFLAF